ncbi:DUF6843 domain-containing protein [Flagellimonas lutimaris]|uniref:DUF6843 domain-containing protein n=1 Tax=Flagellimonas lutimaris TaxID=475082 RepID=UPI003F5CF997
MLFNIGCTTTEDTITLIPNNYTGTVKIKFNKKDGEEKLYEGKSRVYLIPKTGILKTQFEAQYGWHYPKYFYVTDENDRIPIQPIIQLTEDVLDTLDIKKTYVYNFMHLGNTIKVDSLGIETDLNNAEIILTIGNPLLD